MKTESSETFSIRLHSFINDSNPCFRRRIIVGSNMRIILKKNRRKKSRTRRRRRRRRKRETNADAGGRSLRLLRTDGRPVGAVGAAVEAAGVAQVVVVAVATPQRRRAGAAVGALAPLRPRAVVCRSQSKKRRSAFVFTRSTVNQYWFIPEVPMPFVPEDWMQPHISIKIKNKSKQKPSTRNAVRLVLEEELGFDQFF